MELSSHDTAIGEVESLYQSMYLAQCVPYPPGKDPELLRKFQEAADFHYKEECSHLSVYDGPLQGKWDFQAPGGSLGRWPSIARHIEFANDSPSYKVRITIYCKESADDCRKYTNDTLHISPPKPMRFLQEDGWKEAVGNEPCLPGPVHNEAPEYPHEEMTNGVTGRVVLLALTNSCGDVRDVTVEHTSHSRNLDRAAIKAARQWRVDVHVEPDPTQRFHVIRTPVDFRL